MRKKYGIIAGVLIVIFITTFIAISHCQAFREAEAPAEVQSVLVEYARKFPQGRLDRADRLGDRFFMGIIVFPDSNELEVRYVLLGKFREWEPIAEFERLP